MLRRLGSVLRPSESRTAGRYSAEAGLPFDDAALEARLLWIWGSARTGSTWLLRQLCHPLRLSANFPLGFEPPRRRRDPIDAVPLDEFLVSRHIAPPSGEPPVEVDGSLVPATLNNYVGDFPGYAFARSYADVWGPEWRRLVLVRVHAMLERASAADMPLADAPLVVIKEVNGSHAADLVMSLFPRSRMLFLLRDGRDVLDSRLHAAGEGGWLAATEGARFRTPEERLRWARTASAEWACNMEVVGRAYEAHADELRQRLRYEDLLADTEGVLASTFAWAGLERDPARIARIVAESSFDSVPAERRGAQQPVRAASPGLWRENLGREERAVAEEVMGPQLEALGYEPAGS